MNGHVLVLGGARSGKSAFAERLALRFGSRPAYLATAEAGDAEMAERIAEHRNRREARFVTFEEPLALITTLQTIAVEHDLVLVDCLTLWITNMMLAGEDVAVAVAALCEWMDHHSTPRLVVVSSEVGLGVVPDNAMARHFRDLAGTAHQRLAEVCDSVVMTTAGLPMALKGGLSV
ncbi:MAG TPA: bifunctional adenosylcobinamide kinase/adenosylcobinamide-phosphate guanylyltransferase [Devosiaceae bacterium]|nr:bifunctional adenosylcobinamide kinase/adenosylcobinamide-phosphate guanylyltransferase [Devosiaceae bacterium]